MQLATQYEIPSVRPYPTPFLCNNVFFLDRKNQMQIANGLVSGVPIIIPNRDFKAADGSPQWKYKPNRDVYFKGRIGYRMIDTTLPPSAVYVAAPWMMMSSIKRHDESTNQFGHTMICTGAFRHDGVVEDIPVERYNHFKETVDDIASHAVCMLPELKNRVPSSSSLHRSWGMDEKDYVAINIPTAWKKTTSTVPHLNVSHYDTQPYLKDSMCSEEKEFASLENHKSLVSAVVRLEYQAWGKMQDNGVMKFGESVNLVAVRVFSGPADELRSANQLKGLIQQIQEEQFPDYWRKQLEAFKNQPVKKVKKKRKPSDSSSSSKRTKTTKVKAEAKSTEVLVCPLTPVEDMQRQSLAAHAANAIRSHPLYSEDTIREVSSDDSDDEVHV